MQPNTAELLEIIRELKALVSALQSQLAASQQRERTVQAHRDAQEKKIQQLEQKIQFLLKRFFGSKSEKLDPRQLELALGQLCAVATETPEPERGLRGQVSTFNIRVDSGG